MTPLELLNIDVAGHMDDILKHFKQPAKITVLVRRPEHEDGSQDFVMTDDDLDVAISALKMRKDATP